MKTKNLVILFFLAFFGLLLLSCEGSFDFNKEHYKKLAYIMGGNNDFRIFDRTVADLNQDQDTLYITVGVGGTQSPDKDVTVVIEAADSLLNSYNKSNYDIDTAKFARILKPECYTLTSKKAVIKAGESKATIPVILKDLDKLSPDTAYFLNYRIVSIDNYEISKEHSEALFRIHYKNRWSNTKEIPNYVISPARMMTYDVDADTIMNDTTVLAASPKVFPISKNSVRMSVGSYKYEKLEEINANSFVIEIDEEIKSKTKDGDVHALKIKEYKGLKVQQLDPNVTGNPYNNTFIDMKNQIAPGVYTYYKVFMLRFKFENPNKKGEFKVIEKKVRLQYNPKTEI